MQDEPSLQVHIAPARAHIPHRKHAIREISCGYQYPHTALLQGSVFDSHHAAHGPLYKLSQMPQTWRQPAHAFTNNQQLQDETHGHTFPASTYCPSPSTHLIISMRSEKSHVGTSILIQHCCKDPFSIVIMLHTGCFTNNLKCRKLDDSQHMPSRTTNNCKMKHTATPFQQVHIAPSQAHIPHHKHAVREISCGYQYPHTALLQGSVFESHHAAHRLLYKQCQMPQT